MDEKVMVEVYVPAAQQYFDAVLPTMFQIKQVKKQLFILLEECTNNAFIKSEESVFYLYRLQCNLSDEQTLQDIGIMNGDEIIIW